jgi:hypothetical protein
VGAVGAAVAEQNTNQIINAIQKIPVLLPSPARANFHEKIVRNDWNSTPSMIDKKIEIRSTRIELRLTRTGILFRSWTTCLTGKAPFPENDPVVRKFSFSWSFSAYRFIKKEVRPFSSGVKRNVHNV